MRRLVTLSILLLLSIAVAVRLIQLSADMPLYISPCADEGIYVHNARNMVLFGEWVLDEWNNMYISPIFNYFVYLSFSLSGVGFIQARLVSVAASIITIWLVALCLKKHAGGGAAFLGGLILAVNYVYVAFSKMALMEPTMIMFMTMAMYFFLKGRENGVFFYLLCGICCSLAFLTKNLAAFYYLVPYAAVFLGGWKRGRLRACALLLTGQLLVIGIWFYSFYLPNRDFIDLHNRIKLQERMPVSIGQMLTNIITMFDYPFFQMVPFLSLVALVGFLIVGWAILKKRHVGSMEVYGILWLIMNFICFSIFSWRPLRYFLTLLIPMVILSITSVFRFPYTREWDEGGKTFPSPRWLKGLRAGASLLLVLSIIVSTYHLGWAWFHPRVMWPALAKEIRERVPRDSVISGGPAMGASMGINNRLVWIHQLADYSKGDPFGTYGIDYLVVEDRELEFYKMVFPDVLPLLLGRSRFVYRMPLDDRGPVLFIQLPSE